MQGRGMHTHTPDADVTCHSSICSSKVARRMCSVVRSASGLGPSEISHQSRPRFLRCQCTRGVGGGYEYVLPVALCQGAWP